MKNLKHTLGALALVLLSNTFAHSQAVGDMGGVFNVNEMGAATYTLPFDLPVGINGMQPSLGLAYNSQSGNGVAGMGVSIYGTSVITRTARDIYHDGTAKGITYNDNDVYSIDGVRILQPGQYDYRPENSPADYITKNGSGSSQYFVVKLQNGNTAYYGQTSDAKANASVPYAWYLNKMVDAHGNTTTYEYTTDNNCVYLSKVTYGVNTVAFTYENRTDAMPYIVNGVKCTMGKRLKSVAISTNSTSRNNYTLTYSNSDAFSRLTKVEESYGSTKLPAVTLGWSNLPGFSHTHTDIDVDMIYMDKKNPPLLLAGDIKGEGKDFLVVIERAIYPDITLYDKKATNNYFTYSNNITFSKNVDLLTNTALDGSYFADYNGDGVCDLILPYLQNGKYGLYIVYTITPTSFGNYDMSWSLNKQCQPIHSVGNIYNNEAAQVVYMEPVKNSSNTYSCNIVMKTSTENAKKIPFNLNLSSEPKKLVVADFNGNGLQDLLVLCQSGYTIFWNKGVSAGTVPFDDNNKKTGANITDASFFQIGDFNGDGMIDLATSNYKSWIDAYMNNGDGTFAKNTGYFRLEASNIAYDSKTTMHGKVVDLNNDGKQDLVVTMAKYQSSKYQKTYTCWFTSGIVTAMKTATSKKAEDGNVERFVSGDFDGDGYVEISNYGYNCHGSTDANVSPTWHFYKNNSLKDNSNKLTNVATANCGISTSIAYSTLSDRNVYDKNPGGIIALDNVVFIQSPLSVVKQTTQNISAQSYTTNYSYKALRAHLQGRGLLGYATVTVNNTKTGEVRTSTVNSLNSYFEPSKITTTVTLDGKTSKTETTFASTVCSGKCHFTYPQTIKQTDIYGDIATTTNTYNGSYCLTKQRTEYGSSSMYKQVEYSSFVKVGGVNKPQTIVTTQKHSDDASAFSQKTTMTYNSTTGDITKKVDNDASITPLTHTYTYDSYGNILTHNISGNGVTSATTTYTYDGTHRFVASEKSSANSLIANYNYNTLGRLTSKSEGISGSMLATSYSYDAIGNLTKTTYPDGTSTTITRGWGTAPYKRYYVTTSTTGQASVTTYFDDLNREVSSSSTGEKGVAISSTTSYNAANGKVSSSNSKVGSISVTDNYTYNNLGQLTKATYGTGKTTNYTYSKRRQSYTSGNHSGYQSFDLWGNVSVSSENSATSVSYKYSSNGQPTSIRYSDAEYSEFNTASMAYNTAGMQTSLTDVDAGKTTYEYDALGRVTKQTDAKGNVTTNTYNASGLIASSTCGGITTSYTYDSKMRLTKEATGSQSIAYTYDSYDRLTKKSYTIDGTTLNFTYTYNSNGQLASKTFPDGMTENYTYDSYGNLSCIKMGSTRVWELSAYNGISRSAYLGATPLVLSKSYTSTGLPTGTSVSKSGSTLHYFSYSFDGVTGNLKSRTGMNGTESFTYDMFDRLTTGTTYRLTGNIASKTGLGNYTYDSSKKHAVTQVANTTGLVSGTANVTYNAFNKVSKVTLGSYSLTITYGPTRQRCKTVLVNGSNTTTTLYADNYEQRTVSVNGTNTVSTYHYVSSPDGLVAIYVKQGSGAMTPYYVETDHLGSICKIYDANGNQKFSARYDPWGKQTVDYNVLGITRGYCAHEHWNQFGLIDMNGRFYDPVVARFLSPDPYVQDPGNPQNFNRYSYCLNNPLKYTDPSGEIVITATVMGLFISAYMGAIINVGMQGVSGNVNSTGDFLKYSSIGSAAGLAGGYVGSLASGAGLIASGAASGCTSGFLTGAGNTWASGGSFSAGLNAGIAEGVSGGVSGALSSALIGGAGRCLEYQSPLSNRIADLPHPELNRSDNIFNSIILEEVTITASASSYKAATTNIWSQVNSIRSGFNIDAAVAHLNANAYNTYSEAYAAEDGSYCGRHVRRAVATGFGLKQDALRFSEAARDYGPFLEDLGFQPVSTSEYQAGDIAIFQGYPGGYADSKGIPCGHAQMYNGTQWISNFRQKNLLPGLKYINSPYQIYRWK